MATQRKRDAENQEEVDPLSDWTSKDLWTCTLPNRCLVKLIWVSALVIFLIATPSLALYLTNYYGLWDWPNQIRNITTTVKPTTTLKPGETAKPTTPPYSPGSFNLTKKFFEDLILTCPDKQWVDPTEAKLFTDKDPTICYADITKSVNKDCTKQANQSPYNTCKITMQWAPMEPWLFSNCQRQAYSDMSVRVSYRCVDYELIMKQGSQLSKTSEHKQEALLNCGPYYVNVVSAIFDDTSTPNCAAKKNITSVINTECKDQIATPIATDKYILNENFNPKDHRCVIGPQYYAPAECNDRNLTITYKCINDSLVISKTSTFGKDLVINCPNNQWVDVSIATLSSNVDGKCSADVSKSVYRDCSEQANQSPFKTCKITMDFERMDAPVTCKSLAKSDLSVKVYYRCNDYDKIADQGIKLNKISVYKKYMLLNCGPYYANITSAINLNYGPCMPRDVRGSLIWECTDQIYNSKKDEKSFVPNTKFSSGPDNRCVINSEWYVDTNKKNNNKQCTTDDPSLTPVRLGVTYYCIKNKPPANPAT